MTPTPPSNEPPPKNDASEPEDGLQRATREMGERALKKVEAELEQADDRARRGHAERPPRPRGRTTPIAVRFDEFTVKRLKELAARRNTGYQTLLKEFVVERLYEEEKRERIIE
jgi:hypothetical protein